MKAKSLILILALLIIVPDLRAQVTTGVISGRDFNLHNILTATQTTQRGAAATKNFWSAGACSRFSALAKSGGKPPHSKKIVAACDEIRR